MVTKNSDFVDIETIKTFSQIDPIHVLETLLLHKGEQIVNEKMLVDRKLVDYAAFLSYSLKSTRTNEIYVGMILDKYFQQNELVFENKIKVPKSVYEKCKAINDSFRNR
jgi:hypothetical protein